MAKLRLRRDTATNWASSNPVLLAGELGLITTAAGNIQQLKVGDGVKQFSALPTFDLMRRVTVQTTSTILTSTQTSLPHGLGVVPTELDLYLLCSSASNGYAVGEIVRPLTPNASVWADATNVTISMGNNVPQVAPKAGGIPASISGSNWRWVVRVTA